MDVSTELEWTGERLVTGIKGDIVELHLHRYAIASEFVEGKNVLDIASGEGYGTNLLAIKALSVVGVDIDQNAVSFASSKYNRNNLSFKIGRADAIPLEDHSVDVVVSFETIEHHDKHREMLQEIKRVLSPNGVLILSSPDKLNYSDIPKYTNKFHVKELYREDFKKLISGYFKNVKIYYQSMVYSSVIVPEDGQGKNFREYSGDFRGLKAMPSIHYPVYNICIASDILQDAPSFTDNSVFDCDELFQNILSRENEVYNSKTYKAGMLVTFPLRMVRKLLMNRKK
jgi:ubiquinone/menaquinone biosynthesis C-methylase UbiE